MKKAFPIIAAVIVTVFGGHWAWGEVAYRYFRHQCDTRAGEFIYKTVENVEGIYQMRLRDPRDYFDRVRAGDIPEEPFGHTNVEAQEPWIMFIGGLDASKAYEYFETAKPPDRRLQSLRSFRFENDLESTGEKFWIYRRAHKSVADAKHNNMTAYQTSVIKSRYGFTWKSVRDRWDRLFGIWGGELVVVDLSTSHELAVRRGYILWANFSDRTGICPKGKTDYTTGIFVKKVLRPPQGKN